MGREKDFAAINLLIFGPPVGTVHFHEGDFPSMTEGAFTSSGKRREETKDGEAMKIEEEDMKRKEEEKTREAQIR